MSFLNNNLNKIYNNKLNNINLISVEKSPNKNINDLNNQENNNPNDIKLQPSNDLIKSKMEEDSNLSNIKIEREQEFYQNADALFGESDNENEKSKQNVYSNKNELNYSNDFTINEEKRIEAANNLFDRSYSASINYNPNNDDKSSYTMNTINYEKRTEAADKLFQSQSDITSKIDNISLNDSIKSNKTNMTNIINNLTGSNMGLNINELANKVAKRDNMIHESIHSKDNDFIKNDNKDNENIDDDKIEEDEGIQFNQNLIEFKIKKNNSNLNDLNNLGNPLTRNKNNSLKNTLLKSNKKYNKQIINISDNNINNMEEEEEKKEEKKIIKNNIIDESIIRESNEINKKENDKNEKQKEKKVPSFEKLFLKNKNKKIQKNNENVKTYIEDNYSEEQKSNEILMKKKEKEKKDKNNTEKKKSLAIQEEIDDVRKSDLIKEPEKLQSIINKEAKDTNNDSNHLISEKNILLKGRDKLLKEEGQKKFIQIKKKQNKNILSEDKINEIKNEINNSISFNEEINALYFNKKNL